MAFQNSTSLMTRTLSTLNNNWPQGRIGGQEKWTSARSRRAGKERIALKRRGKVVAYVVPAEDVRTIEAIEDRIDAEAARRALKDLRSGKETTRPFAEVEADIERKKRARKAS